MAAVMAAVETRTLASDAGARCSLWIILPDRSSGSVGSSAAPGLFADLLAQARTARA
jgi:hypothetical protein